MVDFLQQAGQAIVEAGGRMTAPRRIILEVIEASHEHLTADQIVARAQRRDRRINPSTVYRTLSLLKAHDLIKSRYFDNDTHREVFEPLSTVEHYHFTCSGCGKVIEFQSKHVPALRQQLQSEFDVEVAHACLCLTGLCADCRRQAK
jgi:Fe2+ or Zn2+ uptake regulation protein